MTILTALPSSLLDLRLFGSPEVRLSGRLAPPLRSRRGVWLLGLLALHHGRELERTWVAGLLWPDSTSEQALYNLRRNLTDLRHALGPAADRLSSPTARTLRLDLAGAEVDLVAFDRAIAADRIDALEGAVALYRGPLLAGCDEAWLVPERAAREHAYLGALEALARAAESRGDHDAATRLLRRVLAVDSLRESAVRPLLGSLAATGEFAAVARAYGEFCSRLHRELNAAPGAETVALFREIRARSAATPAGRSLPAGGTPTGRSRAVTNAAGNGHSPAGALPRPVSSFVGRAREVAELVALLAGARLVTLTGPGGVGKTRLAIRVAEEIASGYADGARFVDLGTLSDTRHVPESVARALGVAEASGRAAVDALIDALHAREIVLVMDNCEHLIDDCAPLIARLLERCPRLTVLATSRQSLGLTGEAVWSTPPLSVPAAREPARAEEPDSLLVAEAVQLLVQRGAAAGCFALSPRNAGAAAELCRRLDGLPLAIELAAARLRVLSVEEIAARLDDRFRLLTGGSRAALPRQRTLRAAMDWSYDLLSEPERALLRHLSVFTGGFTLEAAEAVCAFGAAPGARLPAPGNRLPPPGAGSLAPGAEILDLLDQLVDKSLVHREEGAVGGRFRVLETVRQYGRERLQASGEAPMAERRHRDWFLALAEQAAPALEGAGQAGWIARLEVEHGNLRAAWSTTRSLGEPEVALRLAAALWRYFYMHGRVSEGREWLEQAIEMSGARCDRVRAEALHGAGVLCHLQDHNARAQTYETESLRLWRALGDRKGIADALDQLGHIDNGHGAGEQAGALFTESLALRRELGDLSGCAASLNALGYMARCRGDYAFATALCEESLQLRRALGDAWGAAYSLEFLAQLAFEQGVWESAVAHANESLSLRETLGDRRGIAATLVILGHVARYQGDWRGATSHYERSMAEWREVGATQGIAACLKLIAACALGEGKIDRALAILRESVALYRQAGGPAPIGECLEGLAAAECARGRHRRAARLLGAADVLRQASGLLFPPVQQRHYDQIVAAVQGSLDDSVFRDAWAGGAALDLDGAIAEVLTESSR